MEFKKQQQHQHQKQQPNLLIREKQKQELDARQTMTKGPQESRRGSSRGEHGKENPRRLYAAGPMAEPAPVVRGSSRRINTLRFRPAYIRLINRRDGRLDCSPLGFPQAPNKTSSQFLEAIDRSFHIRDVACYVSRAKHGIFLARAQGKMAGQAKSPSRHFLLPKLPRLPKLPELKIQKTLPQDEH